MSPYPGCPGRCCLLLGSLLTVSFSLSRASLPGGGTRSSSSSGGGPGSDSSRTKNMMWYGVLGTKELVQKTYKNLEQRVKLEVHLEHTHTHTHISTNSLTRNTAPPLPVQLLPFRSSSSPSCSSSLSSHRQP